MHISPIFSARAHELTNSEFVTKLMADITFVTRYHGYHATYCVMLGFYCDLYVRAHINVPDHALGSCV